MHGLGVGWWLVSVVMSVCTGAETVVGVVCGDSGGFEVEVGMHQGSALSPWLFVIVMEALYGEFRVALPWELLCTDDLVVMAQTEDGLIGRHGRWRDFVENGDMRVGVNKARVIIGGEWQKVMQKAVRWP